MSEEYFRGYIYGFIGGATTVFIIALIVNN